MLELVARASIFEGPAVIEMGENAEDPMVITESMLVDVLSFLICTREKMISGSAEEMEFNGLPCYGGMRFKQGA